jgi:hypothetical protein
MFMACTSAPQLAHTLPPTVNESHRSIQSRPALMGRTNGPADARGGGVAWRAGGEAHARSGQARAPRGSGRCPRPARPPVPEAGADAAVPAGSFPRWPQAGNLFPVGEYREDGTRVIRVGLPGIGPGTDVGASPARCCIPRPDASASAARGAGQMLVLPSPGPPPGVADFTSSSNSCARRAASAP